MSEQIVELIARLEKAEGPDRELDHAIFVAMAMPHEWFGSKIVSHFRNGDGYGYNTEDGYRHLDCDKPAFYTTSIDAAMTLVPEDWWLNIEWAGGSRENPLLSCGKGDMANVVLARTGPLAVCIAALKARQAK